MTHLISIKALATVAVALGAFAAAASAHAHSDVNFSIGVQVPGIYVQPAPVYVQPRPIYMPAPNHYGRFDDGRHHGGPHNQWHQTRLYGPYGDFDRDGLINKWDRFPTHPNHR